MHVSAQLESRMRPRDPCTTALHSSSTFGPMSDSNVVTGGTFLTVYSSHLHASAMHRSLCM